MRKVEAYLGTYHGKNTTAGAATLTTDGVHKKTFTDVGSPEGDAFLIAAAAGLKALKYPCEVVIHSTQDITETVSESLDKAAEEHEVTFIKVRAKEHPEMKEAREAAARAAKEAART